MKPSASIARVVLLCSLLAACATPDQTARSPAPSTQSLPDYLASIQPKTGPSLIDVAVRKGVLAIEARDYETAGRAFNRALKLDPRNSALHFLNGLTYHLRAQSGDTSHLAYAKAGYELAIKFDAGNHWAAYQLGRLHFRQGRYAEAQDAFAHALLYSRDNPELLKGLAVASYYERDLGTASKAANKLGTVTKGSAASSRLGAIVAAAVGDFDLAKKNLAAFSRSDPGNGFRTRYLNRRIEDWKRFHDRGGFQLAQDSDAEEGLSTSGDSDDEDSESDGGATKARSSKMCLIDVVIIRSEELATSRRGVNLLNGLKLQFSGSLLDYQDTDTHSSNATKAEDTTTLTSGLKLTFPELNYNLNIFNDNTDRNEIVARPTLVALDGKPSEFFSGGVWHIEIAGADGGEGSVETIPIGIRLKVTPLFLGKNRIQLQVTAERSFVEDRATEPSFTNFGQTTKTSVKANVVLPFDKTLVLSGLSEKETEKLDDGVPVLQDLPVVQYLFSNQQKLALNKSVLVLLTPRRPQYSYGEGSPVPGSSARPRGPSPNVRELNRRDYWKFTPAPNLEAAMHTLQQKRFFREFRSGDVTLERWDDIDSLGFKLRRVLELLYF